MADKRRQHQRGVEQFFGNGEKQAIERAQPKIARRQARSGGVSGHKKTNGEVEKKYIMAAAPNGRASGGHSH